MLQGIVNLVPIHVTARVQLLQVEQPHHLLVMTSTVSLPLTQHHPPSGTPPTHCGMAKAATVVASAAASVVHRGSKPCQYRLHLTLKFAGVSQMGGLAMKKLALSNLKFTYCNCITPIASS